MCGISGFTGKNEVLIKKMNYCNRHRGPDGNDIYLDESVSLGHTRLAILDLSERGHQPMEYGDLVITYNGEVYNYQQIRDDLIKKGYDFSSDCDTEVVLKAYDAWGPDCFSLFDGMWAFCIYDRKKKNLVISRDQFGIKPLYYYADKDRFIFSSMIDAVRCHDIPAPPNNRMIMEYLSFNLLNHTNETFFSNILRLEPGCLMEYDLLKKSFDIRRWYQPKPGTGNETLKDIHDLFEKSVQNRTIADVAVGSCLSGGTDSSAIVCMLNKHLPGEFPTFSLIVPGFVNDESTYIREVGKHTRTFQYTTTISPETFLASMEDFIKTQEEPVTGISVYCQYRVMQLAAEHGIKVLLDGQGGDELFGGYVYYFANYFHELAHSLKIGTLISEMAEYYRQKKSLYPHALFLFQNLPAGIQRSICYNRFVPWVNSSYHLSITNDPKDPRWKKQTLRDILNLTMKNTAIPHLLSWEDKNSMRWGIESRPPFLDRDLYEYSLSLSSKEMIHAGETKYCFKQAMKDILPEKISARTDKVGFEGPSDAIFRDRGVTAFCDEIISSNSFKGRPYWKYAIVREMYDKHKAGTINIGDTIWKWVNLELWLRNVSPEPV